MKIRVVYRREAEGGYSAAVPAFPGCISEGETLEEARANIREAAELYLECMNERDPFGLADGAEELSEEWACESRLGEGNAPAAGAKGVAPGAGPG